MKAKRTISRHLLHGKGNEQQSTSFLTLMSEGLATEYVKLAKSLKPDKVNSTKRAVDAEEA